MNNKIKILCLVTGLVVCLIITMITKAEVDNQDTEVENRIDSPSSMRQVIVSTGTQWMIQTTCKLLKPIQ